MTIHMVKQQMILVAFMQGSNCSNYPASWRHAQTASGFMTVDYYQNIARVLEAGKFHLAFFDDRLAMPSQYHASYEEAVRHGIRVVMMDLVPLMTAMAMATPISAWAARIPPLTTLPFILRGSLTHSTLRDFMQYTKRGTLREFPLFVGIPGQLADQMEAWLHGGACDGFVLAATHIPGAYEDFVRLVVPELQRREMFQTEYVGRTLRENLGLP
jgi:alkanesulfonate monooxygenase SsuD/methylene tetrahydromethanopterin reductase-like flavin-dependent oxidoreductase (luciferase family)